MKRALSFLLSLVMTLSIITGMDVSVFASISTTKIIINDTRTEGVIGSSISIGAVYSSDTYSHNSDTISIDVFGKSGGLTVDGGVSCLGTKEDGIISYSLIANEVGKYTVTISGPDNSSDSIDVYVTESDGYFTVAGIMENYVTSVIINSSGENWVSEIIVDGVSYYLDENTMDSEETENAKGKEVIFTVHNGVIGSFYIVEALSDKIIPYIKSELSPLKLTYEDGKFPDKKIDLSGYIGNTSINGISSYINQNILSKYIDVTLNDINITLTSQNEDIIYFKSGAFSGKNDSITFSLNDSVAIGEQKSFSQVARVNTNYDFPESLKEDTVELICEVSGTCGNKSVSHYSKIMVSLVNNDYNYKSTWEKQSLINLMEQMESSVQVCPYSILSPGEKIEVSSTISAIIINEQMSKLSDDLEAFESIYDMSCYFYGIKNMTMATAGEYFLDAIISECNTASDDLKRELNNLLESLTESKAFSKFIYWYYNNQQLQLGNKKQVNAHCPIDVSVTDEDGVEVLSIVNDEVVTSTEGAAGFVCDSQKTLYLPTDIDHKIKITATADGTMDYSVVEYSSVGEERVVSYSDVPLATDVYYTGSVVRVLLPDASKYNLIASTGDLQESDEVDDFLYTVNEDKITATITDYTGSNANIIIPNVINGYIITGIGNSAFYGCTILNSITIGDSVTSIGAYAFEECTSLTSIKIPDSVTSIGAHTFYGCTNLTSITIPGSVTSIGAFAFYNCDKLTSVIIPDSVISIDRYAFYDCDCIMSVIIGRSVTNVGNGVFSCCSNLTSITISEGVTNVGYDMFSECHNLTSVTIPDSVKSIGSGAFYYCGNLASVDIGDGVERIGDSAFSFCRKLTSITIPDSVKSIGYRAFYYCDSLTSIDIPNSVTRIGGDAFYWCNRLESIYIVDASKWCEIVFENTESNPMSKASKLYINGVLATNIVLDYSVININDYAFYGCYFFTSIIIPNSVTSIGDFAFCGCTGLSSITIPNSVTNIGDSAFSNCTNLSSITIPDSVTGISDGAFSDCENLKYVFYAGSENDWANITIQSYNESLTNAIIHYNSTDHTYGDWEVLKEASCSEDGEKKRVCSVCEYTDVVEIPSPGHDCAHESIVNVEPTCTEVGQKTLICSVCDYTEVIEIPALGHDYSTEWIIDKEVDCTEDGIKSHHCSRCDEKGDITVIESTGHLYGEWIITIEPTYTEEGLRSKTCTVCGDVVTETIDVLSHDYSTEWTIDKAATCTEDGSKSHHCSKCDSRIDITVIPATGHSYSDWDIIAEPTCTEDGSQRKICSSCGDVVAETVGALGHDYSSEWTIDKQATCTEEGSKSHHCSRCNGRVDITIISATNHLWSEWIIDCEPTCTESGSKHKSCSVCKDVVTETIPALGHSYLNEWMIDIEATCTSDGSKSRHCTVCGDKTDVTVIAASGHLYSDWVIDTEATCTEEGLKYKICSGCGIVVTETVSAFGHDYSAEWTIDEEATCTEAGSKSRHCSRCNSRVDFTIVEATGHIYNDWIIDTEGSCVQDEEKHRICVACNLIEKEITPATGHNFADGYCTICGEEDLFEFSIENGCVTITDYKGTETNIVIPAMVEGVPVTTIGEKAFQYCRSFSSITIPDTVTSIGDYAFHDCTNLTSITIPDSVNCIGKDAFYSCKNLTSVVIPDGVTSIGEDAFRACSSLVSVEIGDNVTSIGNGAFMQCERLEKVYWDAKNVADFTLSSEVFYQSGASGSGIEFVFGENVEAIPAYICYVDGSLYAPNLISVTIGNNVISIGKRAFGYCENLTSVTIGDSVTSISDGAFYSCRGLEKVYWNAKNVEDFAHTNLRDSGVFYNAGISGSGIEFVFGDSVEKIPAHLSYVSSSGYCPEIESVIIGNNVTSIGKYAFHNCEYLTSVAIGDNVTNIDVGAFYECTNLTLITIPNSVTSIGDFAFAECPELEKVIVPESVVNIGESAFYQFDGKIYCVSGSLAHEHAVANRYDYVLVNILSTSDDTKINYHNFVIYTSVEKCVDITELLNVAKSSKVVTKASHISGSFELYGTDTTISVYEGDTHIGDYTLVVNGDTNGDSVCDVLDCFDVERTANGNADLTGAYAEAGDTNGDGVIDIADYQAIVNKALVS